MKCLNIEKKRRPLTLNNDEFLNSHSANEEDKFNMKAVTISLIVY